jgi:uncharacterized membrane protein YqjE
MASGADPRHESTGELVRRVLRDLQGLLDRQIDLVKLELREDLQQVARAGKTLGIGLGLLLFAAICFVNFLFLGLDTLLPRWGWLAALCCALLFGLLGYLLTRRGREEVKLQPLARTRETLKEDAVWVKHPLTSNGTSKPSAPISPPASEN